MITLTEREIQLPAEVTFTPSLGSIFQGALIEHMDKEWAEKMHGTGVRPYAQYLYRKEEKILWRIATLDDESFEHIVCPVMDKNKLLLKQKNCEIGLEKLNVVQETSFSSLEEKFWAGTDRIHHIDVNFLTTTSFKKNGTYCIFPETILLFNTLLRKWNTYSDSMTLGESHLENKLSDGMSITGYRLQSRPFSLEGRRIYGFSGNLRTGLFKNDIVSRMAGMLLAFSEYAGIGIKTALGMGAVKTDISYYTKEGTP